MLLSVWFIHEAAIRERVVDYIKAADFFCFFGSNRKIWKSLDQIKPDFTLSYIDCMPEKIWFAFFFLLWHNKDFFLKKEREKPFRLYAVEHFFHTGLQRDKGFWFSFCYCGVLNLIYGVAKMVWGSLFNTPACLAREKRKNMFLKGKTADYCVW